MNEQPKGGKTRTEKRESDYEFFKLISYVWYCWYCIINHSSSLFFMLWIFNFCASSTFSMYMQWWFIFTTFANHLHFSYSRCVLLVFAVKTDSGMMILSNFSVFGVTHLFKRDWKKSLQKYEKCYNCKANIDNNFSFL